MDFNAPKKEKKNHKTHITYINHYTAFKGQSWEG